MKSSGQQSYIVLLRNEIIEEDIYLQYGVKHSFEHHKNFVCHDIQRKTWLASLAKNKKTDLTRFTRLALLHMSWRKTLGGAQSMLHELMIISIFSIILISSYKI